jgi:phosphopantothenoylcysteine decarboxylase/phosphopantothenate--cysteine ligase
LKNSNFHHPSTRIRGTVSDRLHGKKIALGVTGSVAAFKSPEIARELMRLGAEVIPVMSASGQSMIGTDLMWWATGTKPITDVTGDLEHVSMAGVMNKPVDLMLIAPCTTNTIAKLAAGIADTSITLIASSLQGKGIPILILGVAHEDLINSPPIQDSLDLLRQRGIHIIEPVLSEGKAKVPQTSEVIFEVLDLLTPKTLAGSNVIVTGGPTREFIDNVRFISNASSGKTGIEIATEAFLHGAETLLITGPSKEWIPRKISVHAVVSTQDMIDVTLKALKKQSTAKIVLSAAMADFTLDSQLTGKIKSGQNLSLTLVPTKKLSDLIKPQYPKSTLILFKAEWDVTKEELIERAKLKLAHCDGDAIIANDLSQTDSGFDVQMNQVIILLKDGSMTDVSSSKKDLARNHLVPLLG